MSLAQDMRAAAIREHDEMWRRAWQVPEQLRIDEWADRYYQLTGRSALEAGQWRTIRFPFLRELMREMSPDSPTQRVVWMAARQLGKTELLLCIMGHAMDSAPGPMLMVQPTIPAAKEFSKQRVSPAIDASPRLSERVRRTRIKDSENTLRTKLFEGGILRIAGANSSSSLRGMPARIVMADEREEYPANVDHQGDALAIAEACTANFGDSRKVIVTGNPGIRGSSAMERDYLRGDQRRYFLPCPHCKHMDYLTWQGRDWFGTKDGHHHRIQMDTKGDRLDPRSAHMVCSSCGGRVEEGQKTWMLEHGEWRPTAEGDGATKSYQLSALYSPVGFLKWSSCAVEFLGALKDKDRRRDLGPLRSFVNHRLGETWAEPGAAASPKDLLSRLEGGAGVVRTGVGVLMAGVDVQGDRLIVIVWGFGAGEEMWLIDAWEIFGDPAKDPAVDKSPDNAWRQLDEQVLRRRWPHENGRQLKVERVCVDSGNGNHTDRVYRHCVARQGRGVFAIKGGKEIGKPLVGKPSTSNIHGAVLYVLCVDSGKYTFMSRLTMPEVGPGYVHIPDFGDPFKNEEVVNQLTSERLVYGAKGRTWEEVYPANHWLDGTIYAMAGLKIMQGQGQRVNLAERAAEAAKVPEGPAPEPDAPIYPEAWTKPQRARLPLRRGIGRGGLRRRLR